MLWEQLSVFCHWLSFFVQWHSPSLSEIVEMLEFLCPRSVCRRALAHFSVCDFSLPPAKPHQLARTNSSYDCNRNGNRAEMLAIRVCAPSLLLLEGVKGGVSSNLIGSNVLARALREGEEEKLDFFRWNLALWWTCPTNFSRSYFSRIARAREEKKLDC